MADVDSYKRRIRDTRIVLGVLAAVFVIALVSKFVPTTKGAACTRADRFADTYFRTDYSDDELLAVIKRYCESMGFAGAIDECISLTIGQLKAQSDDPMTLWVSAQLNERAANDCRARGIAPGTDLIQRCLISRAAELGDEFSDRTREILDRCRDERAG